MTSERKSSLRFVTWNIRGLKYPHTKFSKVLTLLRNCSFHIAFIQETRVGPDCNILRNIVEDKTGIKWKVYFTVHSPRSKGVAILIRDNVQFDYICHDEDCSGGYIVLFCRLYGKLYTLVNVYNHKNDRIVLGRLQEYLKETALGVLVVGGDFNTVLDPSSGRNDSALRDILKSFTDALNLRDTWSLSETPAEGFTWHHKEKGSRIDMFFLPEGEMGWKPKIELQQGNEAELQCTDHYPLVLTLPFQTQTKSRLPVFSTRLKQLEYNSHRRTGKISGAEILIAVKSLPVKEEHRPDRKNVRYYTTWLELTEDVKAKYNDILSQKKNCKNLNAGHKLLFSEILAKRLNAFISLENKCVCETISYTVIFERSPQNISWSYLKRIFDKLDHSYKQKGSKQASFAPPPDFDILESLLPKTQSSSQDLRDLKLDCPLTSAILNLALDQLDITLRNETNCKTTVSYHKQILLIYGQHDKQEQVAGLVKIFQNDSGVRLSFR